jgi:hypothetical protein
VALVFPDNVKFVTSTEGTGTLAVGSAVASYRGMSVVANGNQVVYRISVGDDWEVSIGTWDSSAQTLTRTVRRSSNGNAALNLPEGDKEVFVGVSEDELALLANFSISLTSFNFSVGPGNFGSLTSGQESTAVGTLNLGSVSSGNGNIAIGLANGEGITTGGRNLLIGNSLGALDGNFSDRVMVGWGSNILIDASIATSARHWSPGVHNDADLGLTGRRWKNGWFQGDITAAGTITGGTVAATSSMTVRGKQVGPLMPGYTGLRVSRTSTTEISVAEGSIHNNLLTRRIDLASATTLDLTNSGHFVNSSSRATDTWYHVLIGLDGDTVVLGLSETLAKPSAWDSWQMIGAVRTNATGSGELNEFTQIDDQFCKRVSGTDLNTASVSTTSFTIRAWCPPMICRVQLAWLLSQPNQIGFMRFRDHADTVTLRNFVYWTGSTGYNGDALWDVDSSGNYRLVFSVATTFSTAQFFTTAFHYPIGEAASYE